MKDRYTEKFIDILLETKDPAVFVGVARILKVPLMEDENTPKKFADVFIEVVKNYSAAPHIRKKELLKILKDANSCKESVDYGNSTKDSAEASTDKDV